VLPEGATCFLQLDGQVHERGLFAHAPAVYALALGRQWKRLRAGCGLQDGSEGSVAFVVRGDGRELFRTPTVRDHQPHGVDVDVSAVETLELVTEDGGDGPNSDWGVWVDPELSR
jgi:hypothetical protein